MSNALPHRLIRRVNIRFFTFLTLLLGGLPGLSPAQNLSETTETADVAAG